MKKYLIPAVVLIAVFAITIVTNAQPAGNQGGQAGGRGGMMMGGRGRMGMPTERPSRAERLAAIENLEDQIAALKAAIQKAPENDPNIANLEGDTLTAFMDVYTPESNAINAIQTTLSSLRGRGGRGGRGGFGGGTSTDVLSELRVLAEQENASQTIARLDTLIQEAQTRTAGRGGMMMGGRGGTMTGGGQGQGRGAARGQN